MADIKDTLKKLAEQIRDERNAGANTALRVGSLLLAMIDAGADVDKLRKIFICKDQDDFTGFMLKLLGGMEVGEAVDSMVAGKGIVADRNGRMQLSRLEVRDSAVFKEIIYNRLNAQEGDTSYSENGVIESVALESDGTYTLKLRKRWENDFTAFQEGDIVYGIVNNLFSTGEYYASWMRVLSKNVPANSISVLSYPDSEVPGGKTILPQS